MDSQLFPREFLQRLDCCGALPPLRVPRHIRCGQNIAAGTGDSLDFQEFRSYVPGDDLRDLDWNIFRRSRKLFLRRYRMIPESSHRILPDNSASIRYCRVRAFTVWRSAALLGARLLHAGDRITLESAAGPGEKKTIAPGRDAVLQWCEILSAAFNKPHGAEEFRLPAKTERSRGMLWVISDFYAAATLDELIRRWHRASFIPIRIFEDDEYRPEVFREYALIDAEDKRRISPPDDPAFDRGYRQEMQRFESFLNTIALRCGGKLHRIECTESVETVFHRFAQSFPKGI